MLVWFLSSTCLDRLAPLFAGRRSQCPCFVQAEHPVATSCPPSLSLSRSKAASLVGFALFWMFLLLTEVSFNLASLLKRMKNTLNLGYGGQDAG